MTNSDTASKWTKAVLTLTKLTRDGRITWQKVQVPPGAFAEKRVAYEAVHDGQKMRLRRTAPLIDLRTYKNIPVGLGLDLLDESGQVLWTFPQVEALNDLLQSVEYHQSGVASFIDRLLKES